MIYLGRDLRDCAAEVFGSAQREGLVQICPAWRVSLLHWQDDCALVDLRGQGAMDIGALPQLAAADLPRAQTQEWARAIYEDFPSLGGIIYPGAHISGDCIAVWERVDGLLGFLQVHGVPQEFALHYPEIWQRLVAFLESVHIRAVRTEHADCGRCATTRLS